MLPSWWTSIFLIPPADPYRTYEQASGLKLWVCYPEGNHVCNNVNQSRRRRHSAVVGHDGGQLVTEELRRWAATWAKLVSSARAPP